jgi:hypothetical protein
MRRDRRGVIYVGDTAIVGDNRARRKARLVSVRRWRQQESGEKTADLSEIISDLPPS